MKACAWRRGCPATIAIASAEDLCPYHSKILEGLIDTTRKGSATNEIGRVELTSGERAEAARRRDARSRRWLDAISEDV